MSRTFFAALALVSLAACSGSKKPATGPSKPAAAPQTRAPAARPKARQAAVRRDTTTQTRNPLTNH